MNANDGKFTAPVDGIYFFYCQARSNGSKSAYIAFYLNGSEKSYGYRSEDAGTDFVNVASQLKLKKGETVWVKFAHYFQSPTDSRYTFFEGHLIRQINS